MSPVRLPFPGSLPEGEPPARLRPEPGFRKPPPPAVKPLGGLTGDRMGHWAQTLLGTARSPGASCPARAGHSGCQAAGPRISVCTQGPPSPQVPSRPALRRVPLQAAHFPSRQRPSPAAPSRDLALALLADLAAAHWGFRGPAGQATRWGTWAHSSWFPLRRARSVLVLRQGCGLMYGVSGSRMWDCFLAFKLVMSRIPPAQLEPLANGYLRSWDAY